MRPRKVAAPFALRAIGAALRAGTAAQGGTPEQRMATEAYMKLMAPNLKSSG